LSLTPEKIEAVQRTWALAASMPDRTAQTFYANLFRLDPTTRPLFANDIERQARKLAETLNFIVDHLEDSETLMPVARDLAVRHVPYGVEARQYDSVGAALVTTLRQLLGQAFTAEDEAFLGSLVAPGHPSSPGYFDPRYPPAGRQPRIGAGP